MSYFNMVCDNCGREVYGCNIVNGMKFCAKCYQETFGETDKDKQIAELQKQLKEKEKYTYTGKEVGEIERKYDEKIDTLEQKLKSQPAEIVKKISGEIYTRMVVECKETKYTDINLILNNILKEYQK